MQRPHSIGALSIATNASIGLAHAPSHGDTPNEIVHGSDIALNRAKSRGRGVISVFDTAKDRELVGWRALESISCTPSSSTNSNPTTNRRSTWRPAASSPSKP